MSAGARRSLNKRTGPRGGYCGPVESSCLFMGGSYPSALIYTCLMELGPGLAKSFDILRKK